MVRMRFAPWLVAVLAFATPAGAQTGTLSPWPKPQFGDSNNNPVAGGKLCIYIAGTTTPTKTWSDVLLSVENSNPIVLDSAGRPTSGAIYLALTTSYKYVLLTAGTDGTCATGSTVWSQDNITPVPITRADLDVTGTAGETLTLGDVVYLSAGDGGKTSGRWYKADAATTYSSTTNWVGIVPTSITSGAAGTIRLGGSLTGLSSLTVGAKYYVGTAGAVTATAPANPRLVGEADTTTSLVTAANPPLATVAVSQGGTGATTLTNHGVLLGQATAAVVATTAGTTSHVLTSNGAAADPSFQALPATIITLLKQGSGTSTAAGATNVDTIAIAGLTAKDSLWVVYTIDSVTADTGETFLWENTASARLVSLTASGVLTAGATFVGTATITQRQGGGTLTASTAQGWNTLAVTTADHGQRQTITGWTGSWTLALRHNGVTATGTFSYVWAVYKVAGQ